ncbi:MAG: hypothetical protein BWY71_01333 [Planctomycetes bacterium ADurb.Bin412]|nr:MAG: hypothetical protein BWY71_01333 [Planctomycetes bacterium ADurb.Bin412]
MLDLFRHHLRLGRRQVHLIDHRQDFHPILHRQVRIGHCLGFHPLRRIHHQQRPLARRQRPRHLIMKIHMSRRINQIQHVLPAVHLILHRHRRRLDRNPPFPLQIHIVQQLLVKLPLRHRPRQLHHPVRQRALAVVYMCNDRKIPYMFCSHIFRVL